MPDHVHALFGFRPTQSLADLMKHVKADSSGWINERSFTNGKFSWQEGYGAFSYSKSEVHNVVNYIHNQKEHHKQFSFEEEYLRFLDDFEVDYDERFVFKSIQ